MADSNTPPPLTVLDLAPILNEPGPRLIDPGQLKALFDMIFSTASVPATGNSQATAAPINAAINFVPSGNSTNYGLQLPPGMLGRQIIVINSSSVALSVYANGQDFIIPAGGGTPSISASQAAQTTAAYICAVTVKNPNQLFYWKQAAPV